MQIAANWVISEKPTEELVLQTLLLEKEGLIIDHYRIQHKMISYVRDCHCIPKHWTLPQNV
jgi:hypothetical protein